jgi:hypothetical protein
MLLVFEYWNRNVSWQEYYIFDLHVQLKIYTHFVIFKKYEYSKVEKMVIHLSTN